MKYIVFKRTAVFLAVMLICSLFAVSGTQASDVRAVYLDGKDGGTAVCYVELLKGQKLTDVRISDKSVAELNRIEYCESVRSSEFQNLSGKHVLDYHAMVYLKVKRSGKTTLSYKLGDKKASQTFNFLPYVNPVELMTVTNADGGKKLAARTKDGNTAKLKLKKSTENLVIKVKAAKGFAVTSMRFENGRTRATAMKESKRGAKSMTLCAGALAKSEAGLLTVRYLNTKNQAELSCVYTFQDGRIKEKKQKSDGDMTVYLAGTTGTTGTKAMYFLHFIRNLKAGEQVSDVQCSDASVVSLSMLSHYSYQNKTKNGKKQTVVSDCYAYIEGLAKQEGEATLSYKVGGRSVKRKITVKGYTNPTGTLTITNVNGGKNLAQNTAGNANAAGLLKLDKNTTDAKLKLKAASGWQIISCTVSDDNGKEVFEDANGVDSVSLCLSPLRKKRSFSVNIIYQNTETKGRLECIYAYVP